MKKKPIEIALKELKLPEIVENNHHRFINGEFGIVNSFASMKSNILFCEQGYLIKEGRIER